MGARRAGSVRFDPYFKIQWNDPITMAWRDVQRRFDRAADAVGQIADLTPANCLGVRLMLITEDGRRPMELGEALAYDADAQYWQDKGETG